ncbi:MAG: AAA family ATPase, partial [Panacibacter sp.]
MEEKSETTDISQQVVTLETEVKGYADKLSYWLKYLAEKILAGNAISDTEINAAFSYLLEELKLIPTITKPDIAINYNGRNSGSYKLDLLFSKLENVEGVNALTENQVIDFSPHLTIIYGANGSGKSGYIRLLKKVFYSKTPEDIVQNIHLSNGHKTVSAKFTFTSGGSDIPLNYPTNAGNVEFEQYAVFDNGSVRHHLDHKNEFEFRPAGLSFFA